MLWTGMRPYYRRTWAQRRITTVYFRNLRGDSGRISLDSREVADATFQPGQTYTIEETVLEETDG